MFFIKPVMGITKIRVHKARAEHKPDFSNTLAHGLYMYKNQCKNQSEGLYVFC